MLKFLAYIVLIEIVKDSLTWVLMLHPLQDYLYI